MIEIPEKVTRNLKIRVTKNYKNSSRESKARFPSGVDFYGDTKHNVGRRTFPHV